MTKILIKYLPGSRGDFLSNVLGNDVSSLNTYYKLLPPENINLIKIHALQRGLFSRIPNTVDAFTTELNGDISYERIFEVCKQTNRHTLRILTNTNEEKIDVMCMNYSKNHITGNLGLIKLKDVDHQENFKKFYRNSRNFIYMDPMFNDDTEYMDRYDEVINFNDLYDVDFLVNLYSKLMNKQPSTKLIQSIKFNIHNNPRYSQSEYYAKTKIN